MGILEHIGDALWDVGNDALFVGELAVEFCKLGAETVIENPGKTAAIAASATATGGLGLVYAPTIAGVVGTTGLLGTTAEGVTISTLSGAALQSASLATLGGGSLASGGSGMAGGTIIVATGSGVTGAAGGSAAALSIPVNS